MRKIMNLFLIVTLNMACGQMKHAKGSVAQTSPEAAFANASPASDASDKVLVAKNLDSGPHEGSWNEESFTVIGTFAKDDLISLTAGSRETVLPLGFIRANWHRETYPAVFEGANPKPTVTDTSEDYPATIAYAIQTLENPNVVSIAVMASKYEKLKSTEDSVNILYNESFVCTSLMLHQDPNANLVAAHIAFPDTLAQCSAFGICNYTVFFANNHFTKSYAELLNQFPESTCKTRERLPTEQTNVTNTAVVDSYEVVLKSDFSKIAKSVSFSAEKQ